MTSRECVRRALTFKECGEIPTERNDVTGPDFTYGRGRAGGVPVNAKGVRTDEWGVEWTAAEDGVCGEVKRAAICDWDDLDGFTPPCRRILFEVMSAAALPRSAPSLFRFLRARGSRRR